MPINSQQLAFARGVATGRSLLDSYCLAFPKASRGSARSAAARLMKHEGVSQEVARLQGEADKEVFLTVAEKREWLARIMRDEPLNPPKVADQLRAVEIDSKLVGDNYSDRQPSQYNPFAVMIALNRPGARIAGGVYSAGLRQAVIDV